VGIYEHTYTPTFILEPQFIATLFWCGSLWK